MPGQGKYTGLSTPTHTHPMHTHRVSRGESLWAERGHKKLASRDEAEQELFSLHGNFHKRLSPSAAEGPTAGKWQKQG